MKFLGVSREKQEIAGDLFTPPGNIQTSIQFKLKPPTPLHHEKLTPLGNLKNQQAYEVTVRQLPSKGAAFQAEMRHYVAATQERKHLDSPMQIRQNEMDNLKEFVSNKSTAELKEKIDNNFFQNHIRDKNTDVREKKINEMAGKTIIHQRSEHFQFNGKSLESRELGRELWEQQFAKELIKRDLTPASQGFLQYQKASHEKLMISEVSGAILKVKV